VSSNANQNVPGSATLHQARRAFRMIVLVSGTMWGTYVPAMIIRVVVFNLGYTFDDIDTRKHLVPAIFLRGAVYLMSFISSAANPHIYYYSRKDLRKAFFSTIGWKSTPNNTSNLSLHHTMSASQ
jgi:hypothetical protein